MVQTIVQDSSDSASNSSDSASVISNTSNAMAQPERGRRTLVVFTPADAEGPAAIQALATVFPRSASIAFGPSKKGKRIAYVNFHSEKAFEEAATKIGQNITICGLRTTVMSHVAKPPLNKPQPQPSQSSQTKEPPKPGPSLQPASSDAAKAHIWYFWDIENLQIPKRISVNGAYIHDLVASIRKHCEDIYPNHMHMEFQAMYAQQNVLSDGARESLHLCSVSLQQYPGRHVKKEQADKCIVTSMNTREHHTAAGKYEQRVFVILTNDGGYQTDLNLLREKGVQVVLIHSQASEIFKKAADYCIPSTWIFDAVKTPNESVVTPYPLNESHDMLNVPNARSRSKSPAPAPRPNKRTMGKEKGAAHGSQAYQNPNGQAGDSSQNNETGPTAQTPPKDCLRINLPQKLGSVTVPILRNCFGPDANVFIKSPQYPNRHAIVTFKDTAKIFRFAGERILVNGEFVNVILVKGTNFRAPPPPAPSPLAPHPPQNQVKDVNVPVPCSPSKFQYITKNRDEFNRICKDIKVTLDQTHAIVKLKGPSTLVGKADDDLKKWLANIQEYAIPDNDFDWFGAKLFFRYHLQRISIQWAVSICLYRHGNNQPVTGLTSYNSDTDAAVKYKVTLVGELKQPGVREATKEIRNLKLGKPVVLELTDRSGAELFERCEESRNVTKIISISNEHHAYIHIQNNQAFIYAFTDKEKEGARKTLESILVGQHTIQVDPIRYQYILRYRSSGMEAIRRKYHAVQITSTSSKEVAKAMQNPSNASGSSDTPSKHDNIILEGPVADITSATAAVEALLNNVNLEHVDVSFPLRHEIMAFRRYESLATTVQSQKNVVVEFSRKVATIEAVTISVVASGEGDVVKETLEEFSAIRFLAKGTYTIPPDKHYPVGRQLDAFKASMLDDLNVSLNFRGRVVDFNAETSESISSAKEGLKSFLEGENTTKVYSIPNDRHRSWFEKYKKEHEIVAIAKRHQTWIKPELRGNCVSYKISGARKNVDDTLTAFKAYVQRLTSKLYSMPLKIERQRAEIILAKWDKIKGIESDNCVDIIAPKKTVSVTIRMTNQIIELVSGNIVHEAVDGIVNAANARLDHDGGIAQVISDAAGPQLRSECQSHITQNGFIPVGQAIATTAGDLRKNGIKYVIHTVGPVWSAGSSRENNLLFAAVESALVLANSKHCKTVSLPPVSTGIFGFPGEKAAKIIVDAVIQTLPKTQLHKVRIIDFKPPTPVKGESATTGKNKEDIDFDDVDSRDNTKMYSILRKELNARRKELENDDEVAPVPRYSSASVIPKFEHQPYQWYWNEDARGKYYTENQPWIMYDPVQNKAIEDAWQRWQKNSQRSDPFASLSVIGDVGGVKSGVTYEVIFDPAGDHKQRNTKTGYKRSILRKVVPIPAGAQTSSQSSTTTASNNKELTPVDYKYWKEHVEFTITGLRTDTTAAAKDIQSLAKLTTSFLPMVGTWEQLGVAERETAVRRIAGRLWVDVELKESTIQLTGNEASVNTARAEVFKWAFERSSEVHNDTPAEWDAFDEDVNCKLVPLDANGDEWSTVEARVMQTMPGAKVKKIERVQNRHLWSTYQHNHRQISKKNGGNVDVISLFHGTRSTPPSTIYESEEGFDPRFSARGMWGKGCYFAVNASYSNGYASPTDTGDKVFFLADVITGDSVMLPADTSISIPPVKEKQNGQFKNERYDSIKGFTCGSIIYIVYSAGRFYPTYLITYSESIDSAT